MAALARWHSNDRPGGRQPLSVQPDRGRPDCTLEDAIENIDIGGPAMVRAAAKNYKSVAVVTDPADYAPLFEEMKRPAARSASELRFQLACKAFSHTAAYDGAISNYLTSLDARRRRTRSSFPSV